MIEVSDNGSIIRILKENVVIDTSSFNKATVRELFVSGCVVNDFSFLDAMPNLEKLVVLDCKSDSWQAFHANSNVRILRLHTLRQGKTYLDNADFITGFPGVQYLYVNNFHIEAFPDVSRLRQLHTIFCSGRKLVDYSSLESVPGLRLFCGWAATDNHRIPAEAFIPVLKNPSLRMFQYTQMSKVEERKLDELVRSHRPDIVYPIDIVENGILDTSKTASIVSLFF